MESYVMESYVMESILRNGIDYRVTGIGNRRISHGLSSKLV